MLHRLLLLSLLLPLSASAQIEIYFNMPVDTTLARPQGNTAHSDQDFSRIAADEIAAARYSVDVAIYNLNVERIADALIAVKDRGVHVRVIGHVENVISSDSRFSLLADAFIPVASNPKAIEGEQQSLMHDKFFVIDARNGAPFNAMPTVITGSWNATTAQTYYDPNNLVVIRDSAVAGAYTQEFEEMWGSTSDQRDSLVARFGATKRDDADHDFMLADGTRIELSFSPSDGTTSRIATALATAQHSIYTANLTFTNRELADTLLSRKNAGVSDIRCIVDNVDDIGSRFPFLSTFAETFDWQLDGLFHHKYAIVDAIPPGADDDPLVVTGSHNWTFSAETINDENMLVIHSARVANQFVQEFAARYNQVGGTQAFTVPSDVGEIDAGAHELSIRVVPNPSRDVVGVQAFLETGEDGAITVGDLLGREVARRHVEAPCSINWHWREEGIVSGLYIVTLRQGSKRVSRMVYLVD